jgi:hypothetical protein
MQMEGLVRSELCYYPRESRYLHLAGFAAKLRYPNFPCQQTLFPVSAPPVLGHGACGVIPQAKGGRSLGPTQVGLLISCLGSHLTNRSFFRLQTTKLHSLHHCLGTMPSLCQMSHFN